MAWITSHQTLREHPKVYALMDSLNISKPQAVGHLHLIWWWCVDYAPDGVLKQNDSQIARAGEWTGEAKPFVEALINAGFLDRADGALAIHDWFEFCGPLITKRLERTHQNKETAEERRTMSAERQTKLAEVLPTVHNTTQQDRKTRLRESAQSADITDPATASPETVEKLPPKKPDGPTAVDLAALWNEHAHPNLPRAALMHGKRKTHASARLAEHPDPDFWLGVIQKVNKAPLLIGETGNGWKCTFDWMINPSNLTKIVEGNYDKRR